MDPIKKYIRTLLENEVDDIFGLDPFDDNYASKREDPRRRGKYLFDKKGKIYFTAVKIEDPAELDKLKSMVKKNMETLDIHLPKDWQDPKDYHMTIVMGTMSLGRRMEDLNKETELQANTMGVSNEAIALGVSGYSGKNLQQHITLKYKESARTSNDIENWVPLPYPFKLTGMIREYLKADYQDEL